MKFFIMTLFLSFLLFAGGDILPVDPISKYEKMENDFNDDRDNDIVTSFKPIIIDNCVTTCGEPAILLPYYGEDIPTAATELCFSEESIH